MITMALLIIFMVGILGITTIIHSKTVALFAVMVCMLVELLHPLLIT